MDDRKGTTIAPSIRVKDVQKSLDFYTKTLGLHESDKLTRKDGKIAYASVGYETPILKLSSVEDVFTSEVKDTLAKNKLGVGVEFRIAMNGSKKIDQFCTEVKAKGATVITEPKTETWGDRLFTVTDPDGYAITFSEHDSNVKPEARNASIETPPNGKLAGSGKMQADKDKRDDVENSAVDLPNKGKKYQSGKSPSQGSNRNKAGKNGFAALKSSEERKTGKSDNVAADSLQQGKGQQAGKTPIPNLQQWKSTVTKKDKR